MLLDPPCSHIGGMEPTSSQGTSGAHGLLDALPGTKSAAAGRGKGGEPQQRQVENIYCNWRSKLFESTQVCTYLYTHIYICVYALHVHVSVYICSMQADAIYATTCASCGIARKCSRTSPTYGDVLGLLRIRDFSALILGILVRAIGERFPFEECFYQRTRDPFG